MAKSLESLVQKLAETLEDKPDPWFNNPSGWLYKPNFKREAQERANVIEYTANNTKPFSWKRLVTGSPYNKRWFRLDTAQKVLRYYKNETDEEIAGDIDLRTIVEIQYSKLFDAPEFSLDLISLERHYTVAAESHAAMVRWAYAFKLVISNKSTKASSRTVDSSKSASAASNGPDFIGKSSLPDEKWLRYDFTYEEPGPLYLNVMGTCHRDRAGKVLKNWVTVISFEPNKEGKPGRSERSGVISVGDYLVGCNGVDLTNFTFNDAMDAIIDAPFPKTLNFLRDTEKSRIANRKEGWAFVYYPALNRRRRRYIEIRNDFIHFRKPAPGGAANSERDAFFAISFISQIKPIRDKTMPVDQRFTLRLICSEGAIIEHVNEEDVAIGSTPVELLELCFDKEDTMNSWRSVLVSPSSQASTSLAAVVTNIQVEPMETIEVTDTSVDPTITSKLALKSHLTNRFSPREFTLTEGTLRWRRPPQKRSLGSKKDKTLFLVNTISCEVRHVRAFEDTSITAAKGSYRYQLSIQTTQATVIMGMEDEATLLRWLKLIRDLIALAPPELTSGIVTISEGIEKLGSSGNDDDGELVDVFLTGGKNDESGASLKGYLFKRSDKVQPGSKPEYLKRWVVLQDYTLTYFKSPSEAKGPAFALGSSNLRQAIAVREATDPSAPENAFEIVMISQVLIFVAIDEDELLRWVEAISDILEMREIGFTPGESGDDEISSNRLQEMQRAVQFSGELHMKRLNRLSQTITWRDRFIVIAAGTVYYYENQSDFYDENKSCAGEFPVVAITRIESSSDLKCALGCGFEVQARVEQGGDSDGLRTYVFEAKTAEIAKEWMTQLCKATGCFTLEPRKNGNGYESVRSTEENEARQNQKLRNVMNFVTGATVEETASAGGTVKPHRTSVLDRNAGRGRGFQRSVSDVAATLPKATSSDSTDVIYDLKATSLDNNSKSAAVDPQKPTATEGMTAMRRPSNTPETAGRGRGLGRGAAFREGSSITARRLSGNINNPPSDA